jgi:uncharacterized protein YgiM (DUF1202 family)
METAVFLSKQVAGLLRYLTSIGLGFTAIALSVMFLFEAPASVRGDTRATMAAIKPVARTARLPQLTASDFDIARAVPVVVTGKAEPRTTSAGSATDPVTHTAALPETDLAAPGDTPAAGQAVVTADAVNVRSGPSKRSTKLATIRSGQVVDLLESDGGWSHIVADDGTSGWIATKFLRH